MGLIYYDNNGVQHELDDWRIVHNSKVDFNKNISPNPVFVTQYDVSIPILAVSIYNNDQTYAIPQGENVRVRLKKTDGHIVYEPILGFNQNRTVVYFEITEQMTILYGEIFPIIEVSFTSNNSTKIGGSSYIPISIRKNPIQNGDEESKDEIVELAELIEEAKALIAEFSDWHYDDETLIVPFNIVA